MDTAGANANVNVLASANPSGLPTSEQDSLNAHLHQLQQLSDRGTHLAGNLHHNIPNIPTSATGVPGVPVPPPPYPTSAADIQAQSFAGVGTPAHNNNAAPDYHHPVNHGAHPTNQPHQYSSDFLMQHQAGDPNAHSQFPFQALQPNQKHMGTLSNTNVISSMARSHNMPQQHKAAPSVYQSNSSNQLFAQPPYPQLAPHPQAPSTVDRSSSIPISHSQHQNHHTRSLLQPAAPYLPQNDQVNRYAQQQQQMPTQAAPNYMLQQAQHLAGVPDDFSSGQLRSHDPRAAAMVGFPGPIQQFDMQRYPGVSQGAPPLGTFTVGSTASAVADPHPDANALLGNHRNDAIYKPLVPRVQQGVDAALPSTSTMQTAYSKTPILGSQNHNDEAVAATAGYRKSVRNKPVPTIKKAPRLAMGHAASAALTAAVANQAEGVPSTVVSDAVGGSTTDIDGSLIERLRGFSHVNHHQQPKQQQLLLPGGPGLPPNLFPSNLDQQALAAAPTLNHDPYRVPTIRRASVGRRDPGVMLPGQPGLTLGAGGQIPMPLNTHVQNTTAAAPEASPDRPFKCKYCQASFGRRDNMQKHERSIHMGERPFVCEICSYAFQKKDHKDKHVRTVHLKERPYQCTLCESRFGQKSDLTKHIRTVHQRIKPFKCEHCGLSFGHRGNKLRHVFVVHQKRKPHVCRICNQAFGERSNLAKHSLAVHKLALK